MQDYGKRDRKRKRNNSGGRDVKTIDSFLWRKSDRVKIQNVRHAARVLLDMIVCPERNRNCLWGVLQLLHQTLHQNPKCREVHTRGLSTLLDVWCLNCNDNHVYVF